MINIERNIWTLGALGALRYTPEQQAAIDAAVAASAIPDESVDYAWSDRIVQRGVQTFAVFGPTARELLAFTAAGDAWMQFEYVPVLVDGRMLELRPDEGRGGALYLMRRTHLRGAAVSDAWTTTYIHTGWLYTSELDMSRDEIEERIADEIDRGENVFTYRPAGWA